MNTNLLLLIAISAAWASGYIFIGAAALMPPITEAAVMTAIAALVIMPGVRYGLGRPLMPMLRRRLWVPLLMGLSAIAVPNLTVVIAEESIAPSLAAVLGATVPVTSILLTTFVTREASYSHRRMLGIVVALLGLVVFVGGPKLLAHPEQILGMAIMMSGGLVFALNGLLAARQTKDLDEYALAAWTIAFGAFALTIAAFIVEQPLEIDYSLYVWSLVGEGVLGLGLAYLGYYVLVARAGPNFASLYAFLVPPIGVTASAIVTDEVISLEQVLGVAVVLAGLSMITQRSARRAARTQEG